MFSTRDLVLNPFLPFNLQTFDTVVSSDLDLVKFYQAVLTDILQTSYPIPEATIDEISEKIITEIKIKCTPLVENGILFERDLSRRLDFLIRPVLQEAKRVNRDRKYSFQGNYSRRLCSKINNAKISDYEILRGDNEILDDIRKWLGDMDNFNSGALEGVWNSVGNNFDKVKHHLKLRALLPEIICKTPYAPTPEYLEVNSQKYVIFEPIVSKLYMHNPRSVTLVGDVVLGIKTRSYTFDSYGIRRNVFPVPNGISFDFPTCEPANVDVVMDANVEYSVQKELKAGTGLRIFTLGTVMLFERSASKTFSKELELRVRMNSKSLRLREPVHVEISVDQARQFMESYNKYEQIMKSMKDANQQQCAALPPGACLAHLIERYPWIEFIEVLRRGGVDAAMNMIQKKPEVLRNLPANENNVLGIAFEEIQIAKMMGEFIRRGTPIELIAGDGQGSFQYNGRHMLTPEFTDAVFYNKVTNEYFAVQFKLTDDPRNLVSMIENWQNTHAHNTPDPNLPEPLLHENVRVIGPNDVVDDLGHQNIGEEIRHRFEQHERIRYTPDDVNVMRQFLNDNQQLLQDILDSRDYAQHLEKKEEVKRRKINLNRNTDKLQRLENTLNGLLEKRSACVKNGESIEGIDNGIMNIEGQITNIKTELRENQQQLQSADGNLQISEHNMRSQIQKKINSKYREEFIKRAALKEMAVNVLVGAAIDGITALICTSGDQYQKYKKGEIFLQEMTKTVLKSTAIATARGAAFGLDLSSFTLTAQYAVANGSAYAGILTTVSKAVGPVLMAGMFIKQSIDIITAWQNGDLTTAGMKKAFGRTISSGGLSIGVMAGSGMLIGGPIGLCVGVGLTISVGVCDYFLGDRIWSLVFKEDPEEQMAVFMNQLQKLQREIIESAYSLLGLSEYATLDEVKECYRKAVLKYHPDKGGDAEIFNAVRAAYGLICALKEDTRSFYTNSNN